MIEDHQLFLGILLGNMTRDQAFTLMRLGRHIERVALISRVLDVRGAQLGAAAGDHEGALRGQQHRAQIAQPARRRPGVHRLHARQHRG